MVLLLAVVAAWSVARVATLQEENEALRHQARTLEARFDQLEAAHRALAQRLARIESSVSASDERPRPTEP